MTIFFFQAEDGMRDLVRSRGLGDVYKRQAQHLDGEGDDIVDLFRGGRYACIHTQILRQTLTAVSYTHLTLPTSDLV